VLGELDVVEDVDRVELDLGSVDEGDLNRDDLIDIAKVDELFELSTCPSHWPKFFWQVFASQ